MPPIIKVKNYFINEYPLPIALLLTVIVHWRWFFTISIMSHGDWGFYFRESQLEFFSPPYAWRVFSLGGLDLTPSFYPFMFLWGLLAKLGLSFALAERLLFMWPTALVSVLGSYLLIRTLINSRLGALVGSFVFTYSTHFLIIQTGHLTVTTAFAFVPLAVWLFIISLEEKKVLWVLWAGFFAFVVSFYEFRVFYILAWIMLLYLLHHLFLQKLLKLKDLTKTIIFGLLPIAIVTLLNFYWLMPFSQTSGWASVEFLQRGLWGSEYLNLSRAMTLFHPFWTGEQPSNFVTQPIPVYFWLLPIAAFSGLILGRRDRNVVFFGMISLLGVLLTKQEAEPFVALYRWLYQHLPGFGVFREASKFYSLTALGYSVLAGSFIASLWRGVVKSRLLVVGRHFLTVVLIFILLWNTKPLITDEVGTLFVPRQLPKDYLMLKDFLLEQDDYFRTLWVPTDSRFSIYTNGHPKIGATMFLLEEWQRRFFKEERLIRNPPKTGERILAAFTQEYSNNLLDLMFVKYVVIPLQDFVNDDDFFVHYGRRRDFIGTISNLPYLEKVDIGTKEVLVFENKGYFPHIYSTKELVGFKSKVLPETVEFQLENPAKYSVILKNFSQPIYLNFSESYHPGWKLKAGEFNWREVLTQKNYFLSDKNHFQTEAGLNSFLLDPEEIKKADPERYTYIENLDGSIDLDLTLYFKPQSYVYVGLIISGITFVVLLSTLVFLIVKDYGWTRKINLLRLKTRL